MNNLLINIVNWFTKITAWLPQKLVFRTKIYYENGDRRLRRPKGPVIIISNHTAVYDYAAFLFVFMTRTLRVPMAEVLFSKQPLGTFLKCMGGIRVDRADHDFSFINKLERVLKKGGAVLIFPESRLPKEGEERPLPFTPSAAYLALLSGAEIIPVFTNGRYFTKDRARVMIGAGIKAADFVKDGMDRKESIDALNRGMRERVIELGKKLDEVSVL